MLKILILFAHPALEKSRVHKRLIRQLRNLNHITIHDLYQVYPDLDIDVDFEKEQLLQHDLIIWQHPFYWYSAPAMIKQWQDLVLEHGWAYGHGGTALAGKKIMNAITCGGSRELYSKTGRNRFTIPEFLAPFNQTAYLCNMTYLPPFVIHGTHRMGVPEIDQLAAAYRDILVALQNGTLDESSWQDVVYMNDAFQAIANPTKL